jgi:hypothetical protein
MQFPYTQTACLLRTTHGHYPPACVLGPGPGNKAALHPLASLRFLDLESVRRG